MWHNDDNCALEMNRRKSAMWSKMDSELLEIARICKPKGNTPLSGCKEALTDFGLQSAQDSLAMGTFPLLRHMILQLVLVKWL